MKLMSYTSAMQQGFVPRLQSMMPQAPQGPSLAGGMLGVGVGQEGDGSLIPTPQGDAGGDAFKDLLPQSRAAANAARPATHAAGGGDHAAERHPGRARSAPAGHWA